MMVEEQSYVTTRIPTKTFWSDSRIYAMILISHSVNYMTCAFVPPYAMKSGPIGFLLTLALGYIVLGIPLTYMEMIIGQFSGRNCITVWQMRSIHRHVSVIIVFLQLVILIYNHVLISFNLQYFFLSFKDPKPFYTCGKWADRTCNLLDSNYSLNEECVKAKYPKFNACKGVTLTYREVQYWRYSVLGVTHLKETYYNTKTSYKISWRICTASAIITTCMYFMCLKIKRIVGIIIPALTVYPYIALTVLATAALLQPGMAQASSELLDIDFERFYTNANWYEIIVNVITYLSLGTGINVNLAANTEFRSPCHKYAVIVVLVNMASCALTVFTSALMVAPHATRCGLPPSRIIDASMSFIFEKSPRYIFYFTSPTTIWLVLFYSTNFILGFRSSLILFITIIELCMGYNSKLENYPGLMSFAASFVLFIITLPLLCDYGLRTILSAVRRNLGTVVSFVVFMECTSFLWCYGLERFSEDVHFMLGIQPSTYFKLCWFLSGFIVAAAFGFSLYDKIMNIYISGVEDLCILFIPLVWCFLGILVNIIISWLTNCAFKDIMRTQPRWGPQDVVLQRSRGMFSAQAMTKEYMYRQYNLQASIIARQRRSNRLVEPNQMQSTF